MKADANNDPDQPPESRRSFLRTPPSLQPKESSKSKTQSLRTVKHEDNKTGHDGDRDRFSLNYDAIVQEQLSKLSENTRNEILYAIGKSNN